MLSLNYWIKSMHFPRAVCLAAEYEAKTPLTSARSIWWLYLLPCAWPELPSGWQVTAVSAGLCLRLCYKPAAQRVPHGHCKMRSGVGTSTCSMEKSNLSNLSPDCLTWNSLLFLSLIPISFTLQYRAGSTGPSPTGQRKAKAIPDPTTAASTDEPFQTNSPIT